MNKKTAFIGHREYAGNKLEAELYLAVENQIKSGCKNFTMGTHGEFDKMALRVCRSLRKKYKDIEIEVVITSFNTIKPVIEYDNIFGREKYFLYADVDTIMYDIEEVYFKKKIIVSNQKMLDNCDTLICYVNTQKNYGGAIKAYNYAMKKGLKIINLY